MKPAPRSSAVRVSSLSIWTISGCRRTSMGQHASGERFITGFRAEFSTTPATRPATRQYASVGYFFKGSSDEAFEGSGRVRRVAKRQIALFRNERWYNCDLLVSDNIGALYWIGEIINYVKSLTGNRAVAGHDQMPDPVAPPWSAGLEPYSC